MDLDGLLAADPKLHDAPFGGADRTMTLPPEVLRHIDRRVSGTARTLETGCGVSTVLFAIKGCDHVCVTPDEYAIARIRAFCDEQGISAARITFKVGQSEAILPATDLGDLDLVLIDGSHSFPATFIDWYYTASHLRVGGTLVIDDTHLWTGEVLKSFLLEEDEWEIDRDFAPRSVAFTKAKELVSNKGWWSQRYVVEMTHGRRLRDRVGRWLALARRGEFAELRRRLAAKLKRPR